MDVLGLYLLQRIPTAIEIQKNHSFERRFFSKIPDNPAASYVNDSYVTSSKDVAATYYNDEI